MQEKDPDLVRGPVTRPAIHAELVTLPAPGLTPILTHANSN